MMNTAAQKCFATMSNDTATFKELDKVSSVRGLMLLALPQRFWVLWDQRQGQHQREADLRASCRPDLRQDVRELGHRSGRHHGSAHCQTHRHRSAPPAAWMQLLVTDDGGAAQVLLGRLSFQSLALPQRSSLLLELLFSGLRFKSSSTSWVIKSSCVISKLYRPISRANNQINRYCKKKKKRNIREY